MAQSIFELDTPYTRKAVIDYRRSGNEATCRNRNLQHITGTFYKSANKDLGDNLGCTLYAYFEEKQLGVYVEKVYNYNRDWTVEDFQKILESHGYCSFDAFMATIRSQADQGKFIQNAHIMFVQHFDPNLADDAREAREHVIKREEELRRQEKQKEAEKFRAEALPRNAREVAKLRKLLAVLRQEEGNAHNEEYTLYRDNDGMDHEYVAFNLLADTPQGKMACSTFQT